MAAHLALMGKDVTLYNRTFSHIEVIAKRKGIELESYPGGPLGFGKLNKATSDIAEALEKAEIIMVVVPSSGMRCSKEHCILFKGWADHPAESGAYFWRYRIRHHLTTEGCKADVTVAEAETFIYASRADGPAQARIFRIKEAVPIAALPANKTEPVLKAIEDVYPQFIEGHDVLHTV
jgi:opine dehydrogenase